MAATRASEVGATLAPLTENIHGSKYSKYVTFVKHSVECKTKWQQCYLGFEPWQ